MRARRNHLLRAHCRFDADGAHLRVVLEELSYETWKPHRGVRWPHDEVRRMLDDAQSELEERARALRLEVTVIRKERAVGLVAGSTATASQRLTYECLEDRNHGRFLRIQWRARRFRRRRKQSAWRPHPSVPSGCRAERDGSHRRPLHKERQRSRSPQRVLDAVGGGPARDFFSCASPYRDHPQPPAPLLAEPGKKRKE